MVKLINIYERHQSLREPYAPVQSLFLMFPEVTRKHSLWSHMFHNGFLPCRTFRVFDVLSTTEHSYGYNKNYRPA